jgi:hypothetical protein
LDEKINNLSPLEAKGVECILVTGFLFSLKLVQNKKYKDKNNIYKSFRGNAPTCHPTGIKYAWLSAVTGLSNLSPTCHHGIPNFREIIFVDVML